MRRLALTSALVWFAALLPGSAFGQASPARLWQDASGKFQVRAVLIDQTETAVRLRTDDGRQLTVPITRLGPADQQYLRSLTAPTDNPFAGGEPVTGAAMPAPPATPAAGGLRALPESASAGDVLALPGTGNTLDLATAAAKPFVPDPEVQPLEIPSVVIQVTPVDAYDKVSPPILTEPAAAVALVSIGRNVSGRPQETRGRIYAANLKGNSCDLVWDQPQAVKVWGHDAATGRTLIVDQLDQFQRGGELLMLEGLATGQSRTLYRRSLPGAGKPGFAPQVEWASLLSGSHVAAVVDGSLLLWDMPAARLIYRVEQVGANPPPSLSHGGTYLAIPTAGGATIIETATGEVCGTASMGGLLKPGVAFHPNGRLLLLCAGNRYVVWDCQQQAVLSEATTTEQLGSHPLNWIGPKMFRSQLGDAVHVELGMSIWKYSTPSATDPVISGDHMLLATTSSACQIVGVPLPHPSADKSLEQLLRAGDSAMLVRPGTEVAIAIEPTVDGVDLQQVIDSLSESVAKAGWTVANRAEITLVAKIGRGETQELNFRSLGGGDRTVSTATLTPFTAELEIRRGSDVLWRRSTTNHIPPMLRLKEGETVQDAVKSYEKPDAGFFALLQLPPRIPKPEISQQVGRSMLNDGQWQDLNTATPPAGRGPLRRRR